MIENLDNFTDFFDDEIQNSQPISLPSLNNTDLEQQDLINIDDNIKTSRPPKYTGECADLRSIDEIDIFDDEIQNSQPISLPSSSNTHLEQADLINIDINIKASRPPKYTGECAGLRSIDEIDPKYRSVFSYQYFNFVQSKVLEDGLYSDKSLVVCAPTGSGKTVVFEMAIVQLLMEMDDKNSCEDFKIIYMAPIKALCTERLTEWYPKFTKLNLLCIEVTGDTDVEFSQLKPYKIIITTPEKWDMLTRRWRDNKAMVEMIKLFLIDEVHILNEPARGPVLEAVVSRMKTVQTSMQSDHRIEQIKKLKESNGVASAIQTPAPKIRFVAVSATISNPEDVAEWLGTDNKPAVYHKFGDECRPVRLKRVVEGYPCPVGTSIFKFDIILNYKLWPIIQRYHDGKPTLIFCNTRKSVLLTAEALSREITINFSPEQRAKLVAVASIIKNKKVQSLVTFGVGCHHAGLLYEERNNIEQAFRNGDLPILITTTTLAMGVNLPAHLVIIKNTQQYVNGAYQDYSISTVLQMVGRAGRPQFDSEATAVIMTRLADKGRYQALVEGCEPLQSYLHKRLAENLNSEAALCTVNDVAQCVQWVRSTFLSVRAARDPMRYLGVPQTAAPHIITKKIEELCVRAMNRLASSGLITMDEATCIESTEAGRLMSIYYLDLETMKHIMKIKGDETLEQLLWIVCESHELSDMHLRVDERRCLNTLNRNKSAATIRYPIKGKITTRQMKLNCIIQAVLGCLPIHEPSLNQEAFKIMRIADRICKCLVAYVTRPNQIVGSPRNYQAVLNSILLAKCIESHLWENSVFVSKQLKGIGPTYSTFLATAGKLNFMLLEESHPRDLERIMNKGPPAGNILRKQISLLPKYQLTFTPKDESCLSLRLILYNKTYLAENIEDLTAGVNHKFYIIIGDTENCLLLLTSFKDRDLIGMYDGQITLDVTRQHSFEHKVTAHCIGSNFVGIDAHCEYQFQDLNGTCYKDTNATPQREINKRKNVKQAVITDTFKIRKRKNYDAGETSVGKQKCEYNVMRKVDSTQRLNNDTNVRLNTETYFIQNLQEKQKEVDVPNQEELQVDIKDNNHNRWQLELEYNDESDKENNEDDSQINCILNEIEQEIHGQKPLGNNSGLKKIKPYNTKHCKIINTYNEFSNKHRKIEKSNYSFIDKIDKQLNVNDKEENVTNDDKNTFAESVKSYIDMFIEKSKNSVNVTKNSFMNLVQIKNCEEADRLNDEVNDKTEENSKITVVKENDVATNVIDDYNNAPNISFNSPNEVQSKSLDFEIAPKDDNNHDDYKNAPNISFNIKNEVQNKPLEFEISPKDYNIHDDYNNAPNISINSPNQDQNKPHKDPEKYFEILPKDNNINNNEKVIHYNIHFNDVVASNNNKTSNPHEIDSAKKINDDLSHRHYNALSLEVMLQESIDKIISNQSDGHCSSAIQKYNDEKERFRPEIKSNVSLKSSTDGKYISNNLSTFNSNSNEIKNPSSVNLSDRIKCNFNKITMNFPSMKTVFVKPLVQTITTAMSNSSIEQSTSNDLENSAKAIECRHESISNNLTLTESNNPVHPYTHDISNTISKETNCNKKISITQTQVNVFAKKILEQKYCVFRELKLNIDITENKTAVKDFDALLKDKQSDYKNEMNYSNVDSIRSMNRSENSLIPLQMSAIDSQKISNKSEISDKQEIKDDPEHLDKTFSIEENTIEKDSRGQNNRTNQKYKKIISSKTNALRQTDYRIEGTTAGNGESRNSEKIKRPFKITDLPSLHEFENTPVSTQPIYFTSEARTNIKKDDIPVTCDQHIHNPITMNSDLEMVHQPELSNDEINMSQSMFNPKTVLEYLKQDIIPPPAQFRDDLTSSDQNNIVYNMKPSTSNAQQSITQSNEFKNINTWKSTDNKRFKEDIDSVQKSSEPIETWILSNDEHVPSQSFQITRNYSNNFRPQLNVRRTKLNEFKFVRKNIFKQRKQ